MDDLITVQLAGITHQPVQVDDDNIDISPLIFGFAAADVPLGLQTASFSVLSPGGNTTYSAPASVTITDSGTPPPPSQSLKWIVTSGAPHIDLPDNIHPANIISWWGAPNQTYTASYDTGRLSVSQGKLPAFGSSPLTSVSLDASGRATLCMGIKPGVAIPANGAITLKDSSGKASTPTAAFNVYQDHYGVALARATGAPADGTTPSMIYVANFSGGSLGSFSATIVSGQGQLDGGGSTGFTLGAKQMRAIQVTSGTPGQVTVQFKSPRGAFNVIVGFVSYPPG